MTSKTSGKEQGIDAYTVYCLKTYFNKFVDLFYSDIGGGKGSNARENGTYKIANKGDNAAIPPFANENVQAKECSSGTR